MKGFIAQYLLEKNNFEMIWSMQQKARMCEKPGRIKVFYGYWKEVTESVWIFGSLGKLCEGLQ